MFYGKRILCISSHMDDVEFGCGGLIKSLENRAEIYVLVLSKDRKNYLGEIQEIRDIDEQYTALQILVVNRENVFVSEGIPGQLFPEYRQKILEEMYNIGALIKPEIIITSSMNDVHQDHRTVCSSAQKAFKRQTRLAYEIVNATEGFMPSLFFKITRKALTAKINAIQCYKSQQNPAITSADYFDKGAIESLARVRGVRMGVQYAESFEVMNIVCFQQE